MLIVQHSLEYLHTNMARLGYWFSSVGHGQGQLVSIDPVSWLRETVIYWGDGKDGAVTVNQPLLMVYDGLIWFMIN